MKVLVISGFLGAGKTTFIQELLRRVHRDFAIMENEVGALGVDGELLQNTDKAEPVKIVELTEGCICCTRQADFASSVLTIANTVDPEVLIVEPTGVGELSKIIANIKKIEYENIELLAPLNILRYAPTKFKMQVRLLSQRLKLKAKATNCKSSKKSANSTIPQKFSLSITENKTLLGGTH